MKTPKRRKLKKPLDPGQRRKLPRVLQVVMDRRGVLILTEAVIEILGRTKGEKGSRKIETKGEGDLSERQRV